MGREARCVATWGQQRGDVTVHLASDALDVRGAFRAATPLAAIRDIRVDDDALRFLAGEDAVELRLGAAAPRWAAALQKPAPSLARKLGIAETTRLLVDGPLDDDQLAQAVALGAPPAAGEVDLLIARVDASAALTALLSRHAASLERGVPIWIVYTKGRAAPLGESAVRAALRDRGLTDVKVVAVSATLTALKFMRTGAQARSTGRR